MKQSSDLRERLVAAFSLAVGACVAGSLMGVQLEPPPQRDLGRIQLSRGVRFSAPAPAIAPKAPDVALPIQTPDAPKQKLPKKQPQAVQEKPSPPAKAELPAAAPPQTLVEPSSYQLPPQLMPPGEVASAPAPDFPMLPGSPTATSGEAKPSTPADDYTPPAPQYLETPGGEVLVLGLLVDHTGTVLKTQILVPSWDGLRNVTLAMVAGNSKLTEIDPPLAPGETRWVEVRYVLPQSKPGILP